MVESAPSPALIVAEAEFLLEFKVVALNAPAQLGGVDQVRQCRGLRQGR